MQNAPNDSSFEACWTDCLDSASSLRLFIRGLILKFVALLALLLVSGCAEFNPAYIEEANRLGITRYSTVASIAENAAVQESDAPGDRDLSGIYVSQITTDHHWYFYPIYRRLIMHVRQMGDVVIAYDSSFQLKLEGRIEGNRVIFHGYPAVSTANNSISVEWELGQDRSVLSGHWRANQHDAQGAWNLVRLENNGMQLYTTTSGFDSPYLVEESEALFDQLFSDDGERNIVFYLHGRGRNFETNFSPSEIPFVERYSQTRFVIVRWLSWGDTSLRPYNHALSSVIGLADFLLAFNAYKLANPEKFVGRKVTLLAHSMGNIPIEVFLRHIYQPGMLQPALFDAVILSSADLSVTEHRYWVEKCDFADRVVIAQNRSDIVLQFSESLSRHELELEGRKLGLGFINENIETELAGNADYIDLTNLTYGSHKHFTVAAATPLFNLLLNGGRLKYPDPGIGLYRKLEAEPVYYFRRTDSVSGSEADLVK